MRDLRKCGVAAGWRMILQAVAFAHREIAGELGVGEVAVDATMGNGHDTLFLARCVGPGGRVHAFDIQESTLIHTGARLDEWGVEGICELHLCGHEKMSDVLAGAGEAPGGIGVVLFNLGYLPGADHGVRTTEESTVAAVEAALPWLRPGGLLVCVCYTGHEGGREEAAALEVLVAGLPQEQWLVARYGFLNQRRCPPHVLIVQRRG